MSYNYSNDILFIFWLQCCRSPKNEGGALGRVGKGVDGGLGPAALPAALLGLSLAAASPCAAVYLTALQLPFGDEDGA